MTLAKWISKRLSPSTRHSYKIADLVEKLVTDNTTKGVGKTGAVKGEWEDKLTRFISRLEAKLDDRRYGFMFAPRQRRLVTTGSRSKS